MPEESPPADRTSLVQVRVGNRVYNARRAPGCACCNHPARMDIERRIVEGHPYTQIAREFSEVEYTVRGAVKILPRIGWSSIRAHYLSNHMPVEASSVRDIAEQRAKELGLHAEDLEERLVDTYLTARLVMSKGVENLANGVTSPTIKETLAAAKLLHDFERDDEMGAGDVDDWQEAMTIYFTQAKEIMPPELWEKFVRRLSLNPQLRALAARMEGSSGSEDIMEAEVVERD